MKALKVLVTGGAGYIGSVLVPQLLSRGCEVRVVDVLRFGGEALLPVLGHPKMEFVRGDVRDAEVLREALRGVDAAVHLAAIVGDPACAKEPELARSVNLEASRALYEMAGEAGVRRFVFASTCSNYGKMADPGHYVDEEAELRPVSLYAETKVAFERFLLGQPRHRPCKPVCLRFATVYGAAPRLRFDLTVNEFSRELTLDRELVVFGEQFWRPYCHVQDLARSIVLALESPEPEVAFEVFNVGDTAENYTKRMIVETIRSEIPSGKVRYVHKEEDPRDYRVDFSKIRGRLGFQITRRVPDGVREIHRLVADGFLLDPYDARFSNLAER